MPVINSIDDMVKVAQEKMDHKIEVDIFDSVGARLLIARYYFSPSVYAPDSF